MSMTRLERAKALRKEMTLSFERNLIIEIDGGHHDEDVTRAYDQTRMHWLETQGFQIIRFWNNEVLANLEGVISRIKEML